MRSNRQIKVMENLASNTGVFAIKAMILMAKCNLLNAVGGNVVRSTTFQLINSANGVNHTLVNKTYERTDSSQHCGMRCANTLSPSFYFVNQTSTCYCNNDHDIAIVDENGPGAITYGYVTVEDITRPGTLPECQALYDMGFRGSGVFNLNAGESITCDIASLGWVVFQRRLDGSVDFYRNWTQYVNGFGDQNGGEFWLGLETIHQQTQFGCELHIYLEAETGQTVQDNGVARYASFSVSSVADSYRLIVGGFSGSVGVGDSLTLENGHQFSTYDVDNDVVATGSCAQEAKGGWWYSACHTSNLNGLYLAGSHASYADGIEWKLPWGYYYSLRRTEMAFRC